MRKNNVIVYPQTPLEKQKSIKLEEGVLTKKISDEIKDLDVYMIENLSGFGKKIVYDGDKIYFVSTDDREKDALSLKIFNKRHLASFIKLTNNFEKIPFSVWAKVIKNEFVFYDMKINTNWVYRDLLEKVFFDAGLKVAPVVYKGRYNEDIVKERLSFKSIYNNKPIESIYIRSSIEEEVSNIRLNFFTNEDSFVAEEDVKKEAEKQAEIRNAVEEFIKDKIEKNSYIKNFWLVHLKEKNLNLESKKSDIYKSIVYKSIDSWSYDLKRLSNLFEVEINVIEKKVKAILPRYIRKILMG